MTRSKDLSHSRGRISYYGLPWRTAEEVYTYPMILCIHTRHFKVSGYSGSAFARGSLLNWVKTV